MDKELTQIITDLFRKSELEIIDTKYLIYGEVYIVSYLNKFYRLLDRLYETPIEIFEVKPKQITTTTWEPV